MSKKPKTLPKSDLFRVSEHLKQLRADLVCLEFKSDLPKALDALDVKLCALIQRVLSLENQS